MKLVPFSLPNETTQHIGALHQNQIYDLTQAAQAQGKALPNTVRDLIANNALSTAQNVLTEAVSAKVKGISPDAVKLHAPLTNPDKILALAGNYQAHITESGAKPVDKTRITPRVFWKPNTTLCGHQAPILLPEISEHVDYELELAVVIGKGGSRIPHSEAMSHVAGYAVYNDVSSRRLTITAGRSERDGDWFYDWLNGKWQDNSGPMGPCLVTADEVKDPMNLWMKLWVNGELRQDANTSQMIFDIAETIAFASRLMTLLPGDIIATGTPSGVGDAIGVYLKPGDVVRCEIEGLGVLENTVQHA